MVPAGISLFGHFRQKDRIPFLSSFHQLVHVTGYLPVGNLCIDLRTVDVRMAHHLGDALYRDAGGQHQGSERMAGHVVGQVLPRTRGRRGPAAGIPVCRHPWCCKVPVSVRLWDAAG